MSSQNKSLPDLRKELRSSSGDRNKLSKLHSLVTEAINNAYGEEKELLVAFRQEVKNALNCRLPDSWGTK